MATIPSKGCSVTFVGLEIFCYALDAKEIQQSIGCGIGVDTPLKALCVCCVAE
jgi:hypothetical protein